MIHGLKEGNIVLRMVLYIENRILGVQVVHDIVLSQSVAL